MKRYAATAFKKQNQKWAILTLGILFIILSGLFILSKWQDRRTLPLIISQDQPSSLIDELNSLPGNNQYSYDETGDDYYMGNGYARDDGAYDSGATPDYNALDIKEGVIRTNDSVFSILDSNGVKREEIVTLINLAKPEVNLRRISIGRKYSITKDDSGRLLGFNLEIDDDRFLDFQRPDPSASDFNLEVQKFQLDKRNEIIFGEIDDSLYSAVIQAGGNPQIALALAEIFAWQIDFLTDMRKGDILSILYEDSYRHGEYIKFNRVLAAEVMNNGELYQAFYYEDPAGHTDYYTLDGQSLRKAFLKSPLSYTRVSSFFTARRLHPIKKIVLPHFAVDYAAPKGTPVVSVADGQVVFSGWKGGYGNYVKIKHLGEYTTGYAHFSGIAKGVKRGAAVKQGQVIGYVGATGLATGPHLDYRIWHRDRYIDPLKAKLPNSLPIASKFRNEFKTEAAELLAELRTDNTRTASNDESPTLIKPLISKR